MASKITPRRLKSSSKRGATQTSKLAKRQRDRQTNRQTETGRQTVKQADNQHTNTQTNRQTDRQKEIERDIYNNIYSFQKDTQRNRRKHRERLYCTMIAKETERKQTANNPCSLFPFHAKPGDGKSADSLLSRE